MVKLIKIIGDAHYEIAENYFWAYVWNANPQAREISLGAAYYAYGCYSRAKNSRRLKKSRVLITRLQKDFSEKVRKQVIQVAEDLEACLYNRPEFFGIKDIKRENVERTKQRFIQEELQFLRSLQAYI